MWFSLGFGGFRGTSKSQVSGRLKLGRLDMMGVWKTRREGLWGLVLLVGGLVSRLWYVDWIVVVKGWACFLGSSWVLGGCCHSHPVVQPLPVSHILPQDVETFSNVIIK